MGTYADSFWGGGLTSTQGYDILMKRNQDSKKMCQELEEYLKKRSKLEYEFSKSLSNLTKCFKFKEQIGKLETAINNFKQELDSIATSHHGAGVFFSNQADAIKAFREEQTTQRKQVEETLSKAQTAKMTQHSRAKQLEKAYTKKSQERDIAVNMSKEVEREFSQGKEVEKARARQQKSEEDAQKADNAYKSGVIVLESTTAVWEQAMENACQAIQELDESRVRYLRQELWTSVNVDSKMSLDIDNCCESVRHHLEQCDVIGDIQAFIDSCSTGRKRPNHYVFKHYTSVRDQDSDTEGSTGSAENNGDDTASVDSGTLSRKTGKIKVFSKFRA